MGRCSWPRTDGRRLDRHGAGRVVRKAARRAGIGKAVTPHALRHAFITAALDAGVPLRDVQEAASRVRGGPLLVPAAAGTGGTPLFHVFGYVGLFLSLVLTLRVIIAITRDGI
jgi:hypothetical protein